MQVLESCIEHGILVRITGDTIAMGPPFVATTEEVQSLVETFSRVIQKAFN
jgi:beta-alanine--pyruvate transaminase